MVVACMGVMTDGGPGISGAIGAWPSMLPWSGPALAAQPPYRRAAATTLRMADWRRRRKWGFARGR